MVWPQTKQKKTLAEFGGGVPHRITSSETLYMHLSGSVAVLSLEVLE